MYRTLRRKGNDTFFCNDFHIYFGIHSSYHKRAESPAVECMLHIHYSYQGKSVCITYAPVFFERLCLSSLAFPIISPLFIKSFCEAKYL